MDRFDIAAALLDVEGRPIDFTGHEYLRPIYTCTADMLVLRFSRQTEKSTTLANLIALIALLDPRVKILVVLPRAEQLRTFRDTRLLPALRSTNLKDLLLGPGAIVRAGFIRCSTGAEIYLRSAYLSADGSRGISATHVILDESQDLAPDTLPVLYATMSHSETKHIVLAGTPKTADNPFEIAYQKTTRREWVTPCAHCRHANIPDDKIIGLHGLVCARCGQPLDVRSGGWVARNPASKREGFWLNYLVVPWYKHEDLLTWRDSFDPPLFKNEYLGLPTRLGDHIVTQEQTENCCGAHAMVRSREEVAALGLDLNTLTLGIDWGGGGASRTAFALCAYNAAGTLHVLYLERMPADEEHEPALARALELTQLFGVRSLACDQLNNGLVLNRELLARFPRGYAIHLHEIAYAETENAPRRVNDLLSRWTVDRSHSISDIFTHVRTKKIVFPKAAECADLLREIWTQRFVNDPQARRNRYAAPPGATDDVLHALTYAVRLARHHYSYAEQDSE